MSWSVSTPRVKKADAELAVDSLEPPDYAEPPAIDQIQSAMRAAKEILKSIPGPFVVVSMSGHANGIGWQRKAGWSDDFISVTVTQFTEAK